MGKLFYGTQSGMSVSVAEMIQIALPEWVDEIVDIGLAQARDLQNEDFLVLGGGTFGAGELTTDWDRFWPQMDEVDFTDKKVALFAVGDAWAYGDTFCSVMRLFYKKVRERGGEIIGHGDPAESYKFRSSASVINGVFIGAAIDEMNQSHLTYGRIARWASSVREQLECTAVESTNPDSVVIISSLSAV
ncbi:flavodoxin [Abditibacteriota bacterium]|nr:flavodoxin [Abditibacteriota bacterium]